MPLPIGPVSSVLGRPYGRPVFGIDAGGKLRSFG